MLQTTADELWKEDIAKLELKLAQLQDSQSKDVVALCKIHSDMGMIYRDHDAMFDAMEQFDAGISLLDELSDPSDAGADSIAASPSPMSPRKHARAHLQYELGLTAKALQDILQAIENFINALRDLDSEKHKDLWLKLHFELGYCFAKTDQPKKAMDFCNTFLRETVSFSSQPQVQSRFITDNWESILQALLSVGEAALKVGLTSLAKKYLQLTIDFAGPKFKEIEEKAQQGLATAHSLPASATPVMQRDASTLSARSTDSDKTERTSTRGGATTADDAGDESASSDWDDLINDDIPAQPKFSLVLAENKIGVDAENPKAELAKFRLLHEQKSFIAVKYPNPTVLYSTRTTDGHTLLNETELETWLQTLILKYKDSVNSVKTIDPKDPLATAKSKLNTELSKLKPYSTAWLSLHLAFLHRLYLSAEYSAECWAQLRTFFTDLRLHVSKDYKPNAPPRVDSEIVQLPIHVVHLACKMWRPDKTDDFNIILQAISSLGPRMDHLSTIVWAETASHYRIVSAKPSRSFCTVYHTVKKHLDAANPDSAEANSCVYICSRALSNLQLHLSERSALTGSHPKDSEDSMLTIEDLPRDDPLWDENNRIADLTELYSRLVGNSFVKAKCAFALGLAKMDMEDFDTAERLFFESAYMLDVLEPPAEGIRPLISELGNNVIICYAQMLQANYKYKYAVHAFDAGLLLLNMRGRRDEYFSLTRAVARVAQEQSDYMRAVDLYTEIVENYRERRCINEAIYVYDILCGLYLELGQFKQAIKSLTMASELLPDHKKFFGDTDIPLPTGSGSSTPFGSNSPSLGGALGNPLGGPMGISSLRQMNFDPLFLKLQLKTARAHLSSYNYDSGVELLERLLRCKVPHSYLVAVIETLSRAYIKKRWLHEAGQALQTLRDLSLSPPTSTSSTATTSSIKSSTDSDLPMSPAAVEALSTYWELSARNYLHHKLLVEGLYCIDRAIHLSVSSRYSSVGRFFYLRGKILHEMFRNSASMAFPPVASLYQATTVSFAPGGMSSASSSSSSSPADAPSVLSSSGGNKRPGYAFPSWQAGIGVGDESITIPAFQSAGDLLQECNATYRTAYNFFRNTGDDPRICKTVSAIAELFLQHLFWPITTKETTFDDISNVPIFEPSATATDSMRHRSAFASARVSVDGAILSDSSINGTSTPASSHWGPNGRPHSERSRRTDAVSKQSDASGTGIFKPKHTRTQSEVSSPRKGETAPAPPTPALPIPIPAGSIGSSRRQQQQTASASSSVKEKPGPSPIGSPLLDGELSDSSEIVGRSRRGSGGRDRHRSKSRERSGRGKSRDPEGNTLRRKGAETPVMDRSPMRTRPGAPPTSPPSHSDIATDESSNGEFPSGSEKSTPTKDDGASSRLDPGSFIISYTTISNAIEVALEVSLRSCNIVMVLQSYLDLAELRFLEGKKETSQTFLIECKEWLFSVFFGDGVQPILRDAAPGFIERLWRLTQRATRLLFMFEKSFVNRHLELVDSMIALEVALEQVRRRPAGDVSSPSPGRSIGTDGSLPAQLAALLRPKSGGFLSRPRSGLITPVNEPSSEPSSLSSSVGDLPSYHASGSSSTPNSPAPVRNTLAKKEAAVREMAFNLWGYLSYVRQQELRNVEGKISHAELHERCEKVVRKMLRIAQTARSSEPEQIVQMNERSDMQARLARRASRRLTLMVPLKKGDNVASRERTDSSLSSLSSPSLNLSGTTPLRSPRKSPSFEEVVDKSAALSKVMYSVQLDDRVIHYAPLTGAKRMQRFGRKSEFTRAVTSKAARSKMDTVYVMIELLDKSHESITIGVPAELPLITVLEYLCDRNNWELDGSNVESSQQTRKKAGLSFFGLLGGSSSKEERVIKKVHRTSSFFKEFRKLLGMASHKKKRRDDEEKTPRSGSGGSSSPKKAPPRSEGLISAALTQAARSTSKGELSGSAATSVVSLAAKRGQASRYQTSSIYPLRSKMNAPISECFLESEYRDNSPEKPVKLFVYLSAAASRRGGLGSSINETLLFSDQVIRYLNSLFSPDSSEKDDTPEAQTAVDAIISELRHAFSPLIEILPDQDDSLHVAPGSKAATELWTKLMEHPTHEAVSSKPLRLICTRFLNCFPWELIFPATEPVVRCPNLEDLLRQPDRPAPPQIVSERASLSDSKKGRRTDSSTLRGEKSRTSSSASSGSSSSSSQSTVGPFSLVSCFFSQGQRAVQASEQVRRQRLSDLISLSLSLSPKAPEFSPDQAAFFPFHCPLVRVARKISHYKSKYKGITFVDLMDHLSDPSGPVLLASSLPNPVLLFCYGDLLELSDLVVIASQQLDASVPGSQPTLMFVPEGRMKTIISRLCKLLSSFAKAHGTALTSKYQQLMTAVAVIQRELHVPVVVLYPPQA
jgi:tetratricopeptide (TPR) repeat protein